MIGPALFCEGDLTGRRFLGLFGKSVRQYDQLALVPETEQPKCVISEIGSYFPNLPRSFKLLEVLLGHHWQLRDHSEHPRDLLSLLCVESSEKVLHGTGARGTPIEVN